MVSEVLRSPAAAERVLPLPQADRSIAWQGIVRNFTLCRTAFSTYKQWRETGEIPAAPAFPDPENPQVREPDELAITEDMVVDFISSGDAEGLRAFLTDENGCGAWIPVTAQDPDGPKIAEATEALG